MLCYQKHYILVVSLLCCKIYLYKYLLLASFLHSPVLFLAIFRFNVTLVSWHLPKAISNNIYIRLYLLLLLLLLAVQPVTAPFFQQQKWKTLFWEIKIKEFLPLSFVSCKKQWISFYYIFKENVVAATAASDLNNLYLRFFFFGGYCCWLIVSFC